MSEILRNMLNKKYPNFSEDHPPSIDDILEWEYWPSFVRIYGMNYCHFFFFWKDFFCVVYP